MRSHSEFLDKSSSDLLKDVALMNSFRDQAICSHSNGMQCWLCSGSPSQSCLRADLEDHQQGAFALAVPIVHFRNGYEDLPRSTQSSLAIWSQRMCPSMIYTGKQYVTYQLRAYASISLSSGHGTVSYEPRVTSMQRLCC